jgi:hypothetical protein
MRTDIISEIFHLLIKRVKKAQACELNLYTYGGNHAVEFTATEEKNRYKIKTHACGSNECYAAYKTGLGFLI